MTTKKKHLIELMIEAGVKWPVGAEYAAQDKDEWLAFYTRKPYREDGKVTWSSYRCYVANSMKKLDLLCRNWHQTIVTREQYAEAVAANVSEPAVMPKASESERDQAVDSVDAVEWHNPPSIEQMTTDYHTKTAEAQRQQTIADEAQKTAYAALLALEKAGELLGLVISINTPK